MLRLMILLTSMLLATSVYAAGSRSTEQLQDLYFGEALYWAFQEDWFAAIARLDTELDQFRDLDQPELDPFIHHYDQAEFDVGDFELAYRMHLRAGRAMTAVIEANVEQSLRNEASYRLAKLYFQKDQTQQAQQVIDHIQGDIPAGIMDDLTFLRAQVLSANGRFGEAIELYTQLQSRRALIGFTGYNLGMTLTMEGREEDGRRELDSAGQLVSDDPVLQAIRDKSNLVLAEKLMEDQRYSQAGEVFDRISLEGAFSNRALLGAGWAAAYQQQYDRALVPWMLLADRGQTNASVQEALLAVPYSYAKLGVYSQAALHYSRALDVFGTEIEKLTASIDSIRAGGFLQALVREELKLNENWVVELRQLPDTPETYYLLDLMASHEFQESLKNYLDLEQLRRKLVEWQSDLDAFEDMIALRRSYYEPLLPQLDQEFRLLDSQMRLRLEQRERIADRLEAMLTAPRPEFLATAEERIARTELEHLSQQVPAGDQDSRDRLDRLRGLLLWTIHTDYDQRFTETYENLLKLDRDVDDLQQQYERFVRVRQAATQSYQGYDDPLSNLRLRTEQAHGTVEELMQRQGRLLEMMAETELSERRARLEEFQTKARFATADSYDRAARRQAAEEGKP